MIRRATLEDLDSLERIEAVCFPGQEFSRSSLRWFLTRREAVAYVSVEAGTVMGSGMASVAEDVGTIGSVAVLPGHRRTGHGRALLGNLERDCIRRGASVLRLQVDVDNGAAVRLYRSMGYEDRGVLPDYYGPGKHALVMTKTVGSEA